MNAIDRQEKMYDVLFRYGRGERDFKRANLSGLPLSNCLLDYANLSSANLSKTDLSCASAQSTKFSFANLKGANLSNSKLSNSSFDSAYLKDANLKFANLTEARFMNSVLEGADFTGARMYNATFGRSPLYEVKFDYQIEDGLLETIRDLVLEEPKTLDMNRWDDGDDFGCGTAKCLSGWAVYLGKQGDFLMSKYNYEIAGLMLLGAEAHSHFFNEDDEAIAWLKTIK